MNSANIKDTSTPADPLIFGTYVNPPILLTPTSTVVDTKAPTITRVEHSMVDLTSLDITFSENIQTLTNDQYSIKYN